MDVSKGSKAVLYVQTSYHRNLQKCGHGEEKILTGLEDFVYWFLFLSGESINCGLYRALTQVFSLSSAGTAECNHEHVPPATLPPADVKIHLFYVIFLTAVFLTGERLHFSIKVYLYYIFIVVFYK